METGGAEEPGHAAGDDLRRQFHQRGQQRRAARIGLATDIRPLVGRQMIQRITHLAFDETALFFDYKQCALAAGKRLQTLGLQRPGHGHLVDRQLRVLLQPKPAQRVQRVFMRLADGHQADRGIR